MQEVDKKNSRKAISANPERQIFEICHGGILWRY